MQYVRRSDPTTQRPGWSAGHWAAQLGAQRADWKLASADLYARVWDEEADAMVIVQPHSSVVVAVHAPATETQRLAASRAAWSASASEPQLAAAPSTAASSTTLESLVTAASAVAASAAGMAVVDQSTLHAASVADSTAEASRRIDVQC